MIYPKTMIYPAGMLAKEASRREEREKFKDKLKRAARSTAGWTAGLGAGAFLGWKAGGKLTPHIMKYIKGQGRQAFDESGVLGKGAWIAAKKAAMHAANNLSEAYIRRGVDNAARLAGGIAVSVPTAFAGKIIAE